MPRTIITTVGQLGNVLEGLMEEYHDGHAKRMAKRTVERTPVDTGALRGSITLSQDEPEIREGNPDPTGSSTKNDIDNKRLSLKKITYITAGEEYASELELGSSRQAPEGFMRVTVSEAQLHSDRTARDL